MALLTRIVGMVTTSNPERAKEFYAAVLGFRELSDDEFAIVFDANGTTLRVSKAQTFTPSRGTVLGWEVDDIYSSISELSSRGVQFEQFNLPFIPQDESGVWTPSNGDKVAWFKDPDGNTLSLSQHNPEHLKG